MADGAAPARGKLRRVALTDIEPHLSDRPRRAGSHTWRQAFDVLTLDADALPQIVCPFDVSDIVSTLSIDDDCALFLEAPAVREEQDAEGRHLGIFGERRLWAALLAGATSASVKVYEVGAAEAALMHYRENACRVDLPPPADAAELARLRDEHRLDVSAIAAKTGRTERHVRERLTLLAAIEPIREAVAAGRCTIEAALYFARRPAEEQARWWPKAVDHARVDGGDGDVVRLDGYVRRLFQTLPLARAPWPLDRVALGSLRQACNGCQKRTDAQEQLFDDATIAECLDAGCYNRKAEAWADLLVENAKLAGIPVLEGREARVAVPLSPTDATGYVDLDAESPILDAARKPLTWRMVLPATVTAKPDAVADLGDGARELVRVERAAEGARAYCAPPDVPELAKARAETVGAIDAWQKAIEASRTEHRAPPPAPPEPPKPAKPGTADERKKKAAKADVEAQIATVRAVYEHGLSDEVAAMAIARIVSSDAVCLVAEMLDASTDAPAEMVRRWINEKPYERNTLAALLAAELLTRGGEDAALPGRWAGAAKPCAGCGGSTSAEHVESECVELGKIREASARAKVKKGVPPCTCPPGRGPHKADCPTLANRDPKPEKGDGPNAEAPGPKAARAGDAEPRSVSPEDTTPAEPACPIDAEAVARLAKAVGIDEATVERAREGACGWLVPATVWACAQKIEAAVATAHPAEVTRDALLSGLADFGDDCVDVACALLVGQRKLHRAGSKKGWRFSLKNPPLLDTGKGVDAVEQRIEALKVRAVALCREKPRKLPQLRIALKAVDGSTPAEREAAIDACLEEGLLVDDGEGALEVGEEAS